MVALQRADVPRLPTLGTEGLDPSVQYPGPVDQIDEKVGENRMVGFVIVARIT